jgi:two-component system secretion response regulator SsrB
MAQSTLKTPGRNVDTGQRPRRTKRTGSISAPPSPVTPRQQQVLALIVQGLTNREIAGELGVSVRTVEVHRFDLMHRLEVRNVAQLIRQAIQLRLLPKNFVSS